MVKYFCDRCGCEIASLEGGTSPLWRVCRKDVCNACKTEYDRLLRQAEDTWSQTKTHR